MSFSKKYTIKIPKNISVVHSKRKKIIVLIGLFGKKVFALKTKIFFNIYRNKIYVSKFPHVKTSTAQIKKLKSYQGTLIALLEQGILETSVKIYQKLKLVGVGYRVFLFNLLSYKILRLKLGYSHEIYFKLNEEIKFFCVKTTAFYIYGNLYQIVAETSAKLKSYKVPEPYKGKGISHENETIVLKKGKKM